MLHTVVRYSATPGGVTHQAGALWQRYTGTFMMLALGLILVVVASVIVSRLLRMGRRVVGGLVGTAMVGSGGAGWNMARVALRSRGWL